jgi:hypothetical protein
MWVNNLFLTTHSTVVYFVVRALYFCISAEVSAREQHHNLNTVSHEPELDKNLSDILDEINNYYATPVHLVSDIKLQEVRDKFSTVWYSRCWGLMTG